MRLDRIGAIKHSRDPSLRPTAGAVFELPFGDQRDLPMRCETQGERLARETAANDENVEMLHDTGAGRDSS